MLPVYFPSCLDFPKPRTAFVLHLNYIGGSYLRLLVDPGGRMARPADEFLVLEPQSNLLLGILYAVGTVADVAADIDGEVALL